MALVKYTYTHKGWVGICPVYISDISNGNLMVDARWWWLDWLHSLSVAVYGVLNQMALLVDPDFEPSIPVTVGMKLVKPVTMEFWEDDDE